MQKENRIYKLSSYWKKKYGKKVYKIIFEGNFTCQNLDGTVGTKGCLFCNMKALATYTKEFLSENSVLENMEYMKKRNNVSSFYAYFQDYTSTYPNFTGTKLEKLNYLKKLYLDATNNPKIIGLAIGTRADAVDEDILDILKEIDKDIIIEIGLQSILDADLKWMRRGHDLLQYEKAVKLIQKYDFEIVSHLILGLPNETNESIVNTAKYINKLGIDGIKIHQLMILKDTDLENLYKDKKVKVDTFNSYAEKLALFISYLDKNIVIHRLYGDAPSKNLIAPSWCLNKTSLQDKILTYFEEQNISQGCNIG